MRAGTLSIMVGMDASCEPQFKTLQENIIIDHIISATVMYNKVLCLEYSKYFSYFYFSLKYKNVQNMQNNNRSYYSFYIVNCKSPQNLLKLCTY